MSCRLALWNAPCCVRLYMNDGCSSAHTCWNVRIAAFLAAGSRLVRSVTSAASTCEVLERLKLVDEPERNEMYRLGSGSSGRLAQIWASYVPLTELLTSVGVVTCVSVTVTYCLKVQALHAPEPSCSNCPWKNVAAS